MSSERLKPVEVKAFARITAKQHRAIAWPQNGPGGLLHREADRALYKLQTKLRAAGCRSSAIAKVLGVSTTRLTRLRTEPPSEKQIEQDRLAYRQQRAIREERWEREKAARREAKRIRDAEEAQDTVAWAKNCLIEAYEDMRGHPDLPVVRDV